MSESIVVFYMGLMAGIVGVVVFAWLSDIRSRLKEAKAASDHTAPIIVPLGCCSDCRWAHRVSGTGWKRMCREAPEWKLVTSDHGCSRYEDEPIEEDSAP